MVRQRLGQVVSGAPAQTEPVGGDPRQLALGAQPLEEEDGLQIEEDDGFERGSADVRIGIAHQPNATQGGTIQA